MADEPMQKIGQGHLQAMLRQGAKEIAQVLPAFPTGTIHLVEEPGLAGNLTPQEVVREKGADAGYESMLRSYSSERDTRALERSPER